MKKSGPLGLPSEDWEALKRRVKQGDISREDSRLIRKAVDLYFALKDAVQDGDEEEMMRLLRLMGGVED